MKYLNPLVKEDSMNSLFLFDIIWKFIFFSTVLTSFYFIILMMTSQVFKNYLASKKLNALKIVLTLIAISFIFISIYLMKSDHDIIANCFGQFAIKEGVFGITRIISAIWLMGTLSLLFKDLFLYRKIIKQLKNSSIGTDSFQINNRIINYTVVSNQFEPVVAGLIKPEIYIPKSISENKSALKQIICHELVHIQNKDGFWCFLNILIHRLNWHNPLSYFSFHKLKIQIEMATDEIAVRNFNLRISDYAEQLVSLIVDKKKDSLLLMNVSGDFLQIQMRLINLKKIQNGNAQIRSFYSGIVCVVFLLGISQAYAAIVEKNNLSYESKMCFQVKHELIIESWIMEKNKSEANKCE